MAKYKFHKYLEKIERYYINEYISEANDRIMELLQNYKTVGVISDMKSGKTFNVFEVLKPKLDRNEIQGIIIDPKLSMINNQSELYGAVKCCNGYYVSLNGDIIASTPESLYRAIACCEEEEKKFLLFYDEVHESYLSYKFRPAVQSAFNYIDHRLCVGLVGMTATPDNLIEAEEFNKWLKIEYADEKKKFEQSEMLVITPVKEMDLKTMFNIILKLSRNKKPKIFKIKSRKKIEVLSKYLEAEGIKVNTWTREIVQGEENENVELFEKAMKGLGIDVDILLSTNLIDTGVELHLKEKPIIVDFMEHTSLIDTIQFIGRFREGTERVYLFIKEREKLTIIDYSKLVAKWKKYSTKQANLHNEAYEGEYAEDHKNVFLKAIKKEDGKYYYEADDKLVNIKAYEEYVTRISSVPEALMEYLKTHPTLNIKHYKIATLKEEGFADVELPKRKEPAEKREVKKIMEATLKLRDREIEVLMSKVVNKNDKWIVDNNKEAYEILHSNEYVKIRSLIYKLSEKMGMAIAYKFVISGEYEAEEKTRRFKMAMLNYETNCPKPVHEDYKEYKFTYCVRKWYETLKEEHTQKHNGVEKKFMPKVLLTEEEKKERRKKIKEGEVVAPLNFDKLLNEVKKIKGLSKISNKTFEKLLTQVFNINEYGRITSIKKYK